MSDPVPVINIEPGRREVDPGPVVARLNSVDDEISEDVDSVMQIYLQAVYIRLRHRLKVG